MDVLIFAIGAVLLGGILLIGPSSVLDFFNRKAISSANTARKALIRRAHSFESNDIEDFLAKFGLTGEEATASYTILRILAELLQVPPEKVACNYEMRKLFAYLEPDIPGSNKAPKEIQPFAYDLVEGIAKLSDKKLWQEKWESTPGFPLGGEDELADFIMQMTVIELLRFFAPIMKQGRDTQVD
ncbi:MAG: hypothetical protein MN733_23920 [Nitrososphaera sp.]|nr:hypothetical protein [Nitrososphaera sp.]